MPIDPWSRPSLEELRKILEGIEKYHDGETRGCERLDLSVPAEIITRRGNTISAMTREISRTGIGLLHRGTIEPGEVTIKMASDSREFEYQVMLEWCVPAEAGMFMSGGQFLSKHKN